MSAGKSTVSLDKGLAGAKFRVYRGMAPTVIDSSPGWGVNGGKERKEENKMAIARIRSQRPVLWGPFFGMGGIQNEMNRLLSDYFGEPAETTIAGLSPAVDLVDTGENIQVKVELPGIDRKDVEILLKDDTLTIKGEKKEEKEEKGENRYYIERKFGKFSRTLTLPSRIKGDKAAAKFVNGVLHVTLPKVDEEKARETRVEVK